MLDPDRVQQEIKEEKEKTYWWHQSDHQQQCHRQSNRNVDPQSRSQSAGDSSQTQWPQPSQWNHQNNSQSTKPHLSSDEQQYCTQNNLCFNCGYPGHHKSECSYLFNSNWVALWDDNHTKTRPLWGQKRPHPHTFVKAQPVHAPSDDDQDIQATDKSNDEESDSQQPNKCQKN